MLKKIYSPLYYLPVWLCMMAGFFTNAQAQRVLSNPSPSNEAKALYCYLQSTFGNKTLSGQMWSGWGFDELSYIQTNTGKQPAILGVDFIAENVNNTQVQLAANYWKKGGIPTIMWHWGAPGTGEGYPASQNTIDINRCFQPGTVEYTAFWAELKKKADHLQTLRDAGIPVLWRPFHELNGGWFWWGKGGSTQFKMLWTTMYNYFVNDRKLNNLIWVLCYTGSPDAAWFPGNQYVDIAGGDEYATNNSSQLTLFNKVKSSIGGNNMPITLHECGIPPDPDQCFSQGATWSWWMEWHTGHLQGVDKTYLKTLYNHNLVITLDEVPNIMAICGGMTNTAPTVNISSPAINASFTSPASITINANAADANGTVSNVQFFNGATLLGSDATSPYSFSWTNVAAGTYTLTAKATDNAGATTTSTPVSIIVNAPNSPPTVTIISPANNTGFAAPASITINANAVDANGTVSNVQFFNGTTLLGSDASAPYSFTWTNVAAGTYSVTAKATDNGGATSTSSAVSLLVSNACTPTAITPYIKANTGAWTQTSSASLTAGGTLILGPQPLTGGSWRWIGPNGFVATTREVAFSNIQTSQGGNYVATYTNAAGCTSNSTFPITVNAVACVQTVITPYTKINTAAWSQTATGSLAAGGTVILGPQPLSGGSWRWTGPNGFVSIAREITLSNIQPSQGGNYVATYTNTIGCATAITFIITVTGSAAIQSAAVVQSIVAPNPSSGAFTLSVFESVQAYSVSNSLGTVMLQGGSIAEGQNVIFGEGLTSGMYILRIQYTNGGVETKTIQKTF